MKKKLILASSIGVVLVVGAVVAALLLSSAPGAKANGNTANGANGSGTIVIAWNKELLKIVKTPGAQPTTLHPTRSYAILHAAIYDAVVSITDSGRSRQTAGHPGWPGRRRALNHYARQ